MDVVIAGGHGQIALRLGRRLAARGDRVRGLVRNPEHAADLEAAGVGPLVCDLEDEGADVEAAVRAADAVVFAAGAGPGSGDARKATMDHAGAVRLVAACEAGDVPRYVMVSAMGAGRASATGNGFSAYLRAKAAADDVLRASGLAWTVVRPGGLTNDDGTGRVRVGAELERGSVPRDDVAAVLEAVLDRPESARVTFDVVAGETPVAEAVAGLVS